MNEQGMTDLSRQSAQLFRKVLEAMARPGRIVDFVPAIEPPAPLTPGMAAIALTLCDFQTNVWLAPDFDTEAVRRYLRFHTGAVLVGAHSEASFAFARGDGMLPGLHTFAQGTHEYPDRSATLIIAVDKLSSDPGVRLKGPGIKDEASLGAAPLPSNFWQEIERNHAVFPLGVDVILVSGNKIAGLPRSTAAATKEFA